MPLERRFDPPPPPPSLSRGERTHIRRQLAEARKAKVGQTRDEEKIAQVEADVEERRTGKQSARNHFVRELTSFYSEERRLRDEARKAGRADLSNVDQSALNQWRDQIEAALARFPKARTWLETPVGMDRQDHRPVTRREEIRMRINGLSDRIVRN